MRSIRFVVVAACALLALAASGCGGGSSDRVGGTQRPNTVVLTLGTHETAAGVREWIGAVERLSHGSLRIEVRNGWRHDEAGYEKDTIADVRAGKIDLATIPARAYDAIGIRSFQGLLAPFLIDSYALERTVLAGDLPARMLAGIKPLGVVGIALVPGGLGKILSVSGPMLAPSDYRAHARKAIGIRPSELAASTFRALGTSSTDLAPGADILDLAGVDQDLIEIVANRYQAVTAGETLPSNVNLWPRVMSIVMNDNAYAALSSAQREVLRNAGLQALGPTVRRLAHDERQALDVICNPPGNEGPTISLLTASPSNLAALHTAVRPVYRQLDRDALTRTAIAAIAAMKKRISAEASPRCPGAPPPRAHAATGDLRVAGDLTATSATTWEGTVTSPELGRGRLVLKHHLRFRSFVTGGLLRLTAHFRSGELTGCVDIAITPMPPRTYIWGGPGVILSAARPLRRYVGLSLRFGGSTRASDLGHVHGGFATDAPSGLPCDYRAGV